MTIADLQKLKVSSPSLSTVKPELGLRADVDLAQLDPFTALIAIILPSFHRLDEECFAMDGCLPGTLRSQTRGSTSAPVKVSTFGAITWMCTDM